MKKTITSTNAPAPIGNYNQAILAGGTLYVSGQIGLDPKTNTLETASLEKETTQVMENMKAILEDGNMNFGDIVKCSIFISDMDDFTLINQIYSRYFEEATAPARETVQVAGLPKGANVEISCIAVK